MAPVNPCRPAEVELARRDVRLTHAVALLWCEAVAVPFDPDQLHPSLAYHVAMEAVDYPALFSRLGVGPQDRAVAGEISLQRSRDVELDQVYALRAVLDPVEHKHGATIGPFEKVTVRSSAHTPDREDPAFTVTATILITRGNGA